MSRDNNQKPLTYEQRKKRDKERLIAQKAERVRIEKSINAKRQEQKRSLLKEQSKTISPISKTSYKTIKAGKIDMSFMGIVLVIVVIGLVMLYSASYPSAFSSTGKSYFYIARQLIFAIIGVILMLIISKIDYRILSKFSYVIYAFSIVLLILVLVLPGHKLQGVDSSGFKRWIYIGTFSFQPSEIAKFAVILLFADLFSKNHSQMNKFSVGIVMPIVLLVPMIGLMIAEPHLSGTIIIVSLGLVLMLVGGVRLKYMGMGAGAIAGGVLIAIFSGAVSYASNRVAYWRNPWSDASGKGYQTIQSLYAIGSGGLFGRGLGRSQQKYLWLPEPQNDFIFSIVVEELGFIGATIILLLFAALVWRGLSIAAKSQDRFGALLATGLVFQVGLQTALNLLVITNTIPNTGISLPFFSYGGTSLIILLAEMGIVLSISRSSSIKKE